MRLSSNATTQNVHSVDIHVHVHVVSQVQNVMVLKSTGMHTGQGTWTFV